VRHQPGYFRPSEVAAFAEGRQLRDRSLHRHHHHHHHPRRRRTDRLVRRGHPHPPVIVLVPAIVLLATAVGTVATLTVMAVLALLPLLLLAAAAYLGVRQRRRMRRVAAAGTAPVPARPAARARPDLVWTRARDRFHQLRTEYAAFECDAMQILRLPALADVSVASTARFVDAFAEAQALESDRFPGPDHATEFVRAVDRAERAWRAARDAAERIRLSGLEPGERAAVERIIKLLTTARDSDSEPERYAAYTRARSELMKLDKAGVLHVPLPAQSALDDAARGQLPAQGQAEPA
jgi:hypothetical protein